MIRFIKKSFRKLGTYISFIPFFLFPFLVTFGDKVMKIQKYSVIFVYILQGKMGKMEKDREENHATNATKIPKTKRQKYGMNEASVTIQGKRCLHRGG